MWSYFLRRRLVDCLVMKSVVIMQHDPRRPRVQI
jgi:hypothetical protein